MTLDEGIIHAEDVARSNHEAATYLADEHPTQAEKCEECAREHEQLAEWLKELKAYRVGESRSEIPNTCGDAVSRAIVQEEITKSIELNENPYQLWYRIRALPSVTPQPCDDAISRQAAISAIEALQLPIMREASTCYQFKFSGMSEAKEAVENLPSITPQQRTGRWKRISIDKYSEHAQYWYRCDKCGKDNLGNTNFCPNCGARMEVKE